MRVSLLVCTYWQDADWWPWFCLSERKYCTGWHEKVLAVPEQDAALFREKAAEFGWRLYTWPERRDVGQLHHHVIVCRADEVCPEADVVCHLDPDAPLKAAFTPAARVTDDGRVICSTRSYSTLDDRWGCWQRATERAIGGRSFLETMLKFPLAYPRALYAEVRRAVEVHTKRKFDDYLLNGWTKQEDARLHFAEYSTLGAVGLRHLPHLFDWQHMDGQIDFPGFVRQFRSLDRAVTHEEELRRICL